MSIPKPTAAELKQWEEKLQEQDLSMRRGANESRVVYGYEDRGLTISTWEDAKNHTTMRRDRVCYGCAKPFLGQADAKFCSSACKQKAYRRRSSPKLSPRQKAKGLVWKGDSTV